MKASPKPSWWDRPSPLPSKTLRPQTTSLNSTPKRQYHGSPRISQTSNVSFRPMTVSVSRRQGRPDQHSRVLLARERAQSANCKADQRSIRQNNLLVESNLRHDQSLNADRTFGEVPVDAEWFQQRNKLGGSSIVTSPTTTTTVPSPYRSEAIRIEILLKEALAVNENHPRPNPFRSAVAFDSLTQIIPQLSKGFQRVMRMISLELLASVYPSSSNNAATSFEAKPFFSLTQLRGQKITQLNEQMEALQKKFDHVLVS